MSERRVQIGPTLFFCVVAPAVGQVFSTPSGRWRVIEVTHSPEDGGWLFTVEVVR